MEFRELGIRSERYGEMVCFGGVWMEERDRAEDCGCLVPGDSEVVCSRATGCCKRPVCVKMDSDDRVQSIVVVALMCCAIDASEDSCTRRLGRTSSVNFGRDASLKVSSSPRR